MTNDGRNVLYIICLCGSLDGSDIVCNWIFNENKFRYNIK